MPNLNARRTSRLSLFVVAISFFSAMAIAGTGSDDEANELSEKLPFSVDANEDFALIEAAKPKLGGRFFSANYANASRSVLIIFDAMQLHRDVRFDDVAFKQFAEESVKRQFHFPVEIVSRQTSKLGTLSALEFHSNAESGITQPIARLHAFFAQGNCFVFSATIVETLTATKPERETALEVLKTWKMKSQPASALEQCR